MGPNLARHLAQVAAGALITSGVIDKDYEAQFTGAVLTLAMLLWSYAEKRGLLKAVGL